MTMSYQRADETLTETYGSGVWLWLHTGDPGEDGTDNVAQVDAGDIARQEVSFGAPESHAINIERMVLSDAEVDWDGEGIDAAQQLTHYSLWSTDEGGQVEDIGVLDQPRTTGSDGVTVPVGDVEVAIEVYVLPAD